MKKNKDFRNLEGGGSIQETISEGRTVLDFSGLNWQMERMRPGQGVDEGIHLLKNELSGNNFSWNHAQVPGDVYTDLYRAGEIEDPFYGRNMGRLKWVQDYEWWYNYAFNVDESFEGKRLTLLFEGVDYGCEVWLNTHYLGRHEGMFSSFSFDVTEIIDYSRPHTPSNLLALKLDPPPKNQKNIAGLKYNFAGDYLTGLIPFGIWRPVKLIATDKVRVETARVETKLKGECGAGGADVRFSCRIDGPETGEADVRVSFELSREGKFHRREVETVLSPGKNEVTGDLFLDNPELWWPWEMGYSPLYDLTVTVSDDKGLLERYRDRTGLREISMAMNPGFTSEEAENPWTFLINGKPMFLRSACWGGPPSFFYGMNSPEKYRAFLSKAREANINNLRIFGWHPAETDEFYSICDELGMTVWTNFSFATQEFRTDREYLEKVDGEIRGTVESRRLHPSNIMWMGGEEVYFSEAHVHSGNRKLMESIGATVRTLTDVPYGDASPLSSREGIRMGYKPKESSHANSHYYAAGAVLMEEYYPRLDFCIIPELTAASSPSVESLKKFIPENELWPMGPSYGYHAADTHLLQTLNYEVFGSTRMDSLETYSTSTQIAQGVIFQFALEHFRRMKPRVSGVSLCHFITNWPIIKWDLVDYYGEKKESYSYVKRCYEPLLPSLEFPKRRYLPGETLEGAVYIINDYHRRFDNLFLTLEIEDKDGECLFKQEEKCEAGVNSLEKKFDLSWPVKGREGEQFHVNMTIKDSEGEILSENGYFFLLADQEKAKEELAQLYRNGRDAREKYGRGYYRYTPEMLDI